MTGVVGWRLGHRPALDGLRGVAVLLVLACHTLIRPLSGFGQEGVDVFFVLSGFLITSLLLEERALSGAVSLRAFYTRRARRLLPALVVFVAVVTAARLLTQGDGWLAAALVLGYSANWAMTAGVDLGYMGNAWSLAIEEQFYLLWPLALLGLARFPRRTQLAVCLGAFTGLCVLRFAYAATLPYPVFEHDSLTRGAPLLVGCALAFFMHDRREGESRPALATLGVLGLLLLPWLPTRAALGGLPESILTAVVIFAVAQGGGRSWLDWAPLRLVGRRSYGLYLWHYPVMIPVLALPLTGWVRGGATVAVLGASWLLAVASWRFIEKPCRGLRAQERGGEVGDRRGRVHRPAGVLMGHQLDVVTDGVAHHDRRTPDEQTGRRVGGGVVACPLGAVAEDQHHASSSRA